MSREPMYYEKENTPLVYFKVLRVLLILWIIASFINLFQSPNIIVTIEHLIVIVLSITVLANFADMKWTGVKCLYALGIFLTIDNLGGAIIYGMQGYDVTQVAMTGIIQAIWAYCNYLYFSKRRPLFAPFSKPDVKQAASPARKNAEPAAAAEVWQKDTRGKLYALEHQAMPELFYENTDSFVRLFATDSEMLSRIFREETGADLDLEGFSIIRYSLTDTITQYVIWLPEPSELSLCRSINVFVCPEDPAKQRYYTVEKSLESKYCLCCWMQDGVHRNFGLCDPDTGDTVAQIKYCLEMGLDQSEVIYHVIADLKNASGAQTKTSGGYRICPKCGRLIDKESRSCQYCKTEF